jgi:hypothetical protein
MQEILNTEWAYLAGIVDGEGSISIYVGAGKCLQPVIAIVNTNESLLNHCCDILARAGIGVGYNKSPRRRITGTKGKKSYAIIIRGGHKGIAKVLQEITPYLVAKRKQAEIVRAFCLRRIKIDYVNASIRTKRGATTFSAEDIAAVNELRRLNFRGDHKYFSGMPEMISVKPPRWRGDGVIASNFRDALRSFQTIESPAKGPPRNGFGADETTSP